MECNHEGYDYDTWFFFYEDFSHFTAKDFSRLGQHHLKELRKQLKEEYRPPSTDDDEFERFLARFEALPIEAPVIEAPAIEALLIEALPVDTNTNEPPNTDSLTFEALPVETDEPAIPSANTTEPSVGDTSTFTIDYYFARSSIPRSLSTTTLIPPQSIPPTNSYLAYTLTFTYTSARSGRFQALQRTGVG
jgi:hypothetical protein